MMIIKWILKWLVLSASVMVAAYLVPGIAVTFWVTALWVGLVLGLINVFIKPVLKILTLPINLITLGVFGIILNALLFWLAAYLVNGFSVATFFAALLGSIIVTLCAWIMGLFIND